jgi:hypothetical protein
MGIGKDEYYQNEGRKYGLQLAVQFILYILRCECLGRAHVKDLG